MMKPLFLAATLGLLSGLPPALRQAPPPRPRERPETVLARLFAERDLDRRLWDEAAAPFARDVCMEGRDRAVCLDAILRLDAAALAGEEAQTGYHLALRALYLEGGEDDLDAGEHAALYAMLARWMAEKTRAEFLGRKALRSLICIEPKGDEVDRVFVRLFTRRSIGHHHRAAGDALLRMRFGPRFAPPSVKTSRPTQKC